MTQKVQESVLGEGSVVRNSGKEGRPWSVAELQALTEAHKRLGDDWASIAKCVGSIWNAKTCRAKIYKISKKNVRRSATKGAKQLTVTVTENIPSTNHEAVNVVEGLVDHRSDALNGEVATISGKKKKKRKNDVQSIIGEVKEKSKQKKI